jgi:hypothetical protein
LSQKSQKASSLACSAEAKPKVRRGRALTRSEPRREVDVSGWPMRAAPCVASLAPARSSCSSAKRPALASLVASRRPSFMTCSSSAVSTPSRARAAQ